MDATSRLVCMLFATLLGACGTVQAPGSDGIAPLSGPPASSVETGPPSAPPHVSPESDPAPESAGAVQNRTTSRSDPAEDPESTDPVDISVVPDEVTEAYVEAVFVELERLFFEALLILRTEADLTLEVTDRLGSVLNERHYQLRLGEFLGFVEDDFPGLHEAGDLRPRVREVVALLDVSPDCVYAETTTDYSGFALDPPAGETNFVVLRLADDSRHVNLNTSPWVYSQIAVGDPDVLREERPC